MAETAIVLFDWKADKPEAIDLKRGQVVNITDRSGNWWRGTADGKTGKFPSNYVALAKDAIKSTATFNYEKTEDPTHLKFKKGEPIEVLKKDNTGWWVGRNAAGAVGTFPANHVQEGAVKKPADEGSSRSGSSVSRSRSPSSRSGSRSPSSRSRSPSSRSGSSRSRSGSSRSGSGSRSRSSRSPSSRSRSGSASSRSASSRSVSSASSDKKKKAAAKPAAEEKKEVAKAPEAKAAAAAPAVEAKARSAPVEESKPAEAAKPAAAAPAPVKVEAKPAAAEAAKPAAEPAKPAADAAKSAPAVEAKPAPAVAAKPAPAPAPAPVAKAAAAKDESDKSGSESESASSRKSGSSKSKSSKSKSQSDKSKSKSSVSSAAPKKAAAAPAKPAPAEEKKAAAAPAVEEKKSAPAVEEKKPAAVEAKKPAAPAKVPDNKSASSRSRSPSDRSRSRSRSRSESRSRTPSPLSSASESPKKKAGTGSGKNKERIEQRRDDASEASRSGRSSRSGSEDSSFVEGFHPAIKIPDAQDKDDLRVLLMINESQDAVKVRHALEGIQDIIHLDKSGLIAKKSGAIPALSKKVQSLIAGGRPKVVKKDLDTCLDLLHQLVLDDFLAASDANDTGLTNPLVSLLGSEAAPDTKQRARRVLIALTAEENLKTCDSIVHAGNLLTLANLFAEGDDAARRDIGIILARVLRVSGRLAQDALRRFHAFTGIVQALNSSDEHIQEAAAGVAFWAVKDSGVCKNRFRAAHGLLPLARLLSSESAKVSLQASAATMELSAHNSENAKHFAKGTSAIPNLVIALRQHSLSHEGVVNEALVHNVCGAIWNIIRDRQYRVLAFLDEGLISPLIPLVERGNGPAHHLAVKLQRKASDVVQAHFYLSMEERWIKYQLAMQDYVRKHEAAVLADYRGEPLAPGVLEDQVKYDPYFTHHDHDPNVHRHAPRIPAIHHFVAAGFNGPNVHVDPLVSGAPNGLRMHHTLAVPAANLPLGPPSYNGGAKAAGIFASKKVFKGSNHKPSNAPVARKHDVPVN